MEFSAVVATPSTTKAPRWVQTLERQHSSSLSSLVSKSGSERQPSRSLKGKTCPGALIVVASGTNCQVLAKMVSF